MACQKLPTSIFAEWVSAAVAESELDQRRSDFWNDSERIQSFSPTPQENRSPKHFKMMCNMVVDGKRANTQSKLSKSIVNACVKDGIHIVGALEKWNCSKESKLVSVGDIAHMYYGHLKDGSSKHFVGEVLSTYRRFSGDESFDNFRSVKKIWDHDDHHSHHRNTDSSPQILFCRVDWKEVAMTPEDEAILKDPSKNGFKRQGTILRIR